MARLVQASFGQYYEMQVLNSIKHGVDVNYYGMTIDQICSLSFCFMLLFLTSCDTAGDTVAEPSSVSGLGKLYEEDFMLGAALGTQHIEETDTIAVAMIEREFNTITPENVMKWANIHPAPDSFFFEQADQYVAFGQRNDMHIVGHALVWHSQIGEYMNEVTDSTEMVRYLERHIRTVAGRYRGKIKAWDVVNEAFNEDGSFRESQFYRVLGEDYLEIAFRLAAEAAPGARLIYNDYNLWKPEKRAGVVRLVRGFQEKGIKIDAVGMQGHYSLEGPELTDIENSVIAFAELGVDVLFTELDVTVLPNPWELEGAEISQNFPGSPFMNPYPEVFPDSMQTKLSDRYAELFEMFLRHRDKVERVTFWGVDDGHSWLNNWPIEERTNHPLLFDRGTAPKPAYYRLRALKNQD